MGDWNVGEWKDSTSYSRGGDRTPMTWTLSANDFRITVTCGHIYYRGIWIAHCDPFFREYELGVKTKEAAQYKAIQMVRERLEKSLAALSPAVQAPHENKGQSE